MTQSDAVVIGAGPVGLFQAFQLGLLGLSVEIIDVLPHAGGQCIALYPNKPIYDVPGIPRCTGRELTALLLEQCKPFLVPKLHDVKSERPHADQHEHLHLGQQVVSLQVREDATHPFELSTSGGAHFAAHSVFVAAGAGAFVPKAWPVPGLDQDALPANVHHHLPEQDQTAPWAGQHLVIAGGGDDALHAVLTLMAAPPAQRPARLSLLHRREQLQAEPALLQAVQDLINQGQVQQLVGVPQNAELGAESGAKQQLQALHLLGPDGQSSRLALNHLLVQQGLSPKLGPLHDWGLALARKQVVVDPGTFTSSTPGIHAVGDINTYPGKKRLLLCGFHEATLAAHDAAARLRPNEPQHLQYTTTSALLHQRLGLVDNS